MKPKIVEVPSIAEPIQPSPGFKKKLLSDHKLDLLGLCGFGCRYCSSNWGNYLRIRRSAFAELTEQQIGERITPDDDPALMFVWTDVLEKLRAQIDRHSSDWGAGRTIVFSMLTDGFSPWLVSHGITEEALRLVLEGTAFRIRVLTKNAVVGSARWIDFFARFAGRFVVGLSTGTLDEDWARRIEVGTSTPSARLRALRELQSAGVPTYGMLCPVFPDVLVGGRVEALVTKIGPDHVEHMWAEPYNDRQNWQVVRDAYTRGTFGYEWMTDTYERGNISRWSRYATDLYLRLREQAEVDGWLDKMRFLLYEESITAADAGRYRDLSGIILQSKPGPGGRSQNRYIAELQRAMEGPGLE